MNPAADEQPFIPGTKVQYAWDSTSLTRAMSCAMRYKLEIIDGWQPKNPNVAVALVFGILLHAGIEHYHRCRAQGLSYDDAVQASLRHVLERREGGDRPMIETLPTDADIEELRYEDAEDEESDGYDLRNSKIRTRYHLMRALVWYFEQYRQDHLEVVILNDGAAAVEHSFRVPVGIELSNGHPILLSGHFDKLVRFNGQLFVSDIKSTKSITHSWRNGFSLSHQMTGYTVGGKIGLHQPVQGVFIDAVCLQVGGVKFTRFPTYRSESQLQEFLRLLGYKAREAERWHADGYYPQNTDACLFCPFKEVCSQPPEFRQATLSTYYKQVPAWNPLKIRG